MSTLRKLQQDFIAAVYSGEKPDIDWQLTKTRINGTRRLQIYHNNIYISLRNALSAVYPVISRLVGTDFFKLMADDYIQQYPSRSGNLHDFGAEFSRFIENYEPARSLIYLSDVARLEWSYHCVFHAADGKELALEKLQQIQEYNYHNLVFAPNPASRLIRSPYPILKIWQTNQDLSNSTESGSDQITIRLDEGETRLLVIRKGLDIEFKPLDQAEFDFLHAIYKQGSFFDACEAATRANPHCDISSWLLHHIQNQTLTDCYISE